MNLFLFLRKKNLKLQLALIQNLDDTVITQIVKNFQNIYSN
jgi:hypothetical protein